MRISAMKTFKNQVLLLYIGLAGRRLLRQKKAMLHARDSGLLSDIEIHLEGGTRDARYIDEIGRRGLSPADLEATLEQAVGDGFKVRPFCGYL